MEAWLILDIGHTIRLSEQNRIDLPDDVNNATLIIGTEEYITKGLSENLPDEYSLSQNYPNPFNPSTSIRFALPHTGHVSLEIYNMLGQRVRTLVDEEMKAGYYTIEWNGQGIDGKQVASGIYFYRMNTGNYQETKKMLLLK